MSSTSLNHLFLFNIVMAHGLNLKVVAEGVETKEQLALLQAMECDYAQGYFLGKPMPADDMTVMLKPSATQAANHTELR